MWGKHPLNSNEIGWFRFCENITIYKSTPSFSKKIFITLRSRVQIPVSLQSLSRFIETGFFNAKPRNKLAWLSGWALKKPNANRRFVFERLWVRRTIWDADVVGHPDYIRIISQGLTLNRGSFATWVSQLKIILLDSLFNPY